MLANFLNCWEIRKDYQQPRYVNISDTNEGSAMDLWKPIKNYEGLYEVSDLGRVRRVGGFVNSAIRFNDKVWRKGHLIKQNAKRNGYLTVDLSNENTVKTISVHRIVAEAFLEKIDGKEVVNHKNCNKHDNRAENLEWCTAEENREHAKANGCYRANNCKAVRCKQTNKTFESSYKAAEWLNETKFKNAKQVKNLASKIRENCLGHQSVAYGYTWEYI